jgi:hypothetical protein
LTIDAERGSLFERWPRRWQGKCQMAALSDAFSRLRSGGINADAFERSLAHAVLYFPCWNAPEQPNRGWRLSNVGESFEPMIITRDDVPIMPIFEDANQIGPWLSKRGDDELAKRLSFVTMSGGALLRSISPQINVLLVLSDGCMVEFDRLQLARMRAIIAS